MTTRSTPTTIVITEARERLQSPVKARGRENSVARVIAELLSDVEAQRVLGKSYRQLAEDIYGDVKFAPAIRAAYKRLAQGASAKPSRSTRRASSEPKCEKVKDKKTPVEHGGGRRSTSIPDMFSSRPDERNENEHLAPTLGRESDGPEHAQHSALSQSVAHPPNVAA